jgi:hypothetical protein
MHGRGRGFGPHFGATLLRHEDQPEPELRLRPRRARGSIARQWHATVAGASTDWIPETSRLDTRDQREPLTWCFVVERVTVERVERVAGIEPALSAWELACHTSPTTVFAAQKLFSLSVNPRYRPA